MKSVKHKIIEQSLKDFGNCPKCNKGHIIHAGNYYCSSDKCNFMINEYFYNIKITKTRLKMLLNKYHIEELFLIELKEKLVRGFIIFNPKTLKLEVRFPNNLPLSVCPKCKKNYVVLKYSEKNDSTFYGCLDYKGCKFTLSSHYRDKKISFNNLKSLCDGKTISKEILSKNGFKYTISLKLNDSFKITNT